MEFVDQGRIFSVVTQIVFVDLLLSGDNAILIALACRNLAPEVRLRALILGTVGAVALRTFMTAIAELLVHLPMLELIGAVLLLGIAIKLLVVEEDVRDGLNQRDGLWGAVATIVIADIAMSADNVLAIAAAAQGSFLYMATGLLLSIPLLMFGSVWVGRLMASRPLLIPAGAALLGWIAGQLAVSDPLVAGGIHAHAPALEFVIPAICALFVVFEGEVIREQRARLGAGPPFPWRAKRRALVSEPEVAKSPVEAGLGADVPKESNLDEGRRPAHSAADDVADGAIRGAIAQPLSNNEQLDSKDNAERRILRVLAPVIAVCCLLLLGWVVVRMLDASSFLPTPRRAVEGGTMHGLPQAPRVSN